MAGQRLLEGSLWLWKITVALRAGRGHTGPIALTTYPYNEVTRTEGQTSSAFLPQNIICLLYTVLFILSTVQNTMSSYQHLMKTTSILIKPTNTEPGFDSKNTNLWVQACQVTAQQANTVPSPLPTTSLSPALFSCCRQLRAAETSNLLLGDRARPEQACGVGCAVEGVGRCGEGTARLASASALARPCLAALNLSPIKSPSLAGCNWARRAGSMWLLKMRRVE